jgi:hypothetical protein
LPFPPQISLHRRKKIEHTWSKSRIQSININADIHLRTFDSLFQGVNDSLGTNFIDVSCADYGETAAAVVGDILFRAGDGGADGGMNGGVED